MIKEKLLPIYPAYTEQGDQMTDGVLPVSENI
jgi:hypothetical protein